PAAPSRERTWWRSPLGSNLCCYYRKKAKGQRQREVDACVDFPLPLALCLGIRSVCLEHYFHAIFFRHHDGVAEVVLNGDEFGCGLLQVWPLGESVVTVFQFQAQLPLDVRPIGRRQLQMGGRGLSSDRDRKRSRDRLRGQVHLGPVLQRQHHWHC